MKVTIEMNVGTAGFAQEYTLHETRAPKAYDYPGTIQVEDSGSSRIVAIPDEDVPIQTARYQSGMYGTTVVGDEHYFAEADLLDLLINRLIACRCQ